MVQNSRFALNFFKFYWVFHIYLRSRTVTTIFICFVLRKETVSIWFFKKIRYQCWRMTSSRFATNFIQYRFPNAFFRRRMPTSNLQFEPLEKIFTKNVLCFYIGCGFRCCLMFLSKQRKEIYNFIFNCRQWS